MEIAKGKNQDRAGGRVMEPRRIKSQRRKGWRKPEGCVIVTRHSRWSNPCKVGRDFASNEEAVALFERDLLAGTLRTGINKQFHITVEDVRRELKGETLACACGPDEACHADVLLEIADGGGRAMTSQTRTKEEALTWGSRQGRRGY